MISSETDAAAVETEEVAAVDIMMQFGEIAFAKAIARAVRALPWIVRMSSGHFAVEATYGPGERVDGVVLHHQIPHAISVEVRVVVAEAMLLDTFPIASPDDSDAQNDGIPRLLYLADQVRAAVAQTVRDLGLPAFHIIDIAIDDVA